MLIKNIPRPHTTQSSILKNIPTTSKHNNKKRRYRNKKMMIKVEKRKTKRRKTNKFKFKNCLLYKLTEKKLIIMESNINKKSVLIL